MYNAGYYLAYLAFFKNYASLQLICSYSVYIYGDINQYGKYPMHALLASAGHVQCQLLYLLLPI